MTVLGLGLAVAGVGGLAFGTVKALSYKSDNDKATSMCPEDKCATQGEYDEHGRLVDDAKTAGTLAIVGLSAGGALLAGGIFLMLAAPSRDASPRSPTGLQSIRWMPTPTTGLSGAGFVAVGAW